MFLTVILGLAVGVPLGFALQKGGFCMNSASLDLKAAD